MVIRIKHDLATLAIAFAGALLAPMDCAHAVQLSTDGIGQVLIYPYYTVSGGKQTVFSITNMTEQTKAVRVRVNEARNGKDVLNFNLYLARYDTWVGALFLPSIDSESPARLITQDRSCTVPRIDPIARPAGVDLRSDSYTGSERDHPLTLAATLGSPARTREGFIEVIEMGELRYGDMPLQLAEAANPPIGGNLPLNCDALVSAWTPNNYDRNWVVDSTQQIDMPKGGLFGYASIIDVAEGTMLSVGATALTGFYTDASAPGGLNAAPGSARPSLKDARSGSGRVTANVTLRDGRTRTESFPDSAAIDAVSLALLQTRVINDFLIDPALGASTEWVLTYPTKRFYVDAHSGGYPSGAFLESFNDDGKAPVPQTTVVRDRVGRASVAPQGDCCSGDACGIPPPCDAAPRTNNSVNVLLFARHSQNLPTRTPILGASLGPIADVIYADANFEGGQTPASGWAALENGDPTRRTSPPLYGVTGAYAQDFYVGLPVIGFSATRVINDNLSGGVLANYAAATPHQGEVELRTSSP